MRRACVVLLFIAVTAFAQVKESITVSYVEVPVTVVDRSGNAVRGLTKANFEIVDEGAKRTINGFEAVDFASREAELPSGSELAVPAIAPAARRNFLLVFDLSYSSPHAVTRAKEAARKFVRELASKDDLIGVATLDVAYGFRVLASFTTDRAIVDAAIAAPGNFRALDPLGLAGVGIGKEVEAGLYDESTRKGGGSSGPTETNSLLVEQRRADDAYNRQKVEREVNLIGGLSKTLRFVRGEKHIVLLSEGFDARLVQGHEASLDQQTVEENVAVERGHLWLVDSDRRYGSAESMSLVERMADVAKRSGVVVDTIDIAGIRTNVDPREGYQTGSDKKSNEGLHLISGVTGGTVFKNSNNLAEDFRRVMKAEDVVYVLAFQAPASQPGKFHNIKVRLVDGPGGARVMARSGYYEAGGEGKAERTISNAEIIVNDIPEDAVRVASLAVPFPTAGDNAQVPVILEIDGKDVALGTTSIATVEIFTYAFDDEGKVRDSLFQTAALDLNKVGSTLRSSGVKYYATLSLPPGAYAVKTLVRVAETDRKGYVRSNIVVPEKGAIAVSQPLFQDQGMSWVMVKGGSHDRTHAAYPFELNGSSFVPSAAVHIGDEPRRFVVFVQNAVPDDLTIATHPDAKLVAQLRSDHGAKLVYEIPPQPPTSVLNVEVRKHDERHPVTSSITLQ